MTVENLYPDEYEMICCCTNCGCETFNIVFPDVDQVGEYTDFEGVVHVVCTECEKPIKAYLDTRWDEITEWLM